MKNLKKLRSATILLSIAMIIFGAFLTAFPLVTLRLLVIIMGLLSIATGIANIVGYFSKYDVEHFYHMGLASGIVLCVLGLFLLVRNSLVLDIAVIILGLLIFLKNVTHLPGAFELKAAGEKKWWIPLIFNLLLCLLGIFMFVTPISFERVVVILVGVSFIIEGASDLVWIFVFSKKIKTVFKKDNKTNFQYIDTEAEERDE